MPLTSGHLLGIGAMGTAAIEPLATMLVYVTHGLARWGYDMQPGQAAALATLLVLGGVLGGANAVKGKAPPDTGLDSTSPTPDGASSGSPDRPPAAAAGLSHTGQPLKQTSTQL